MTARFFDIKRHPRWLSRCGCCGKPYHAQDPGAHKGYCSYRCGATDQPQYSAAGRVSTSVKKEDE